MSERRRISKRFSPWAPIKWSGTIYHRSSPRMARRGLGRGLVVILVTSGTISLLLMVFMFLLPIVLYLTTEIFSLPHSGHGRYSISLLSFYCRYLLAIIFVSPTITPFAATFRVALTATHDNSCLLPISRLERLPSCSLHSFFTASVIDCLVIAGDIFSQELNLVSILRARPIFRSFYVPGA